MPISAICWAAVRVGRGVALHAWARTLARLHRACAVSVCVCVCMRVCVILCLCGWLCACMHECVSILWCSIRLCSPAPSWQVLNHVSNHAFTGADSLHTPTNAQTNTPLQHTGHHALTGLASPNGVSKRFGSSPHPGIGRSQKVVAAMAVAAGEEVEGKYSKIVKS